METATAKQIQQDILSAQVALLESSKTILEKAKEEPQHIKELKEMGFSGSATALEKRLEAAEHLLRLQDMYSFEYPGLKFIPRDAMTEVCMKYGLAIGHVSRYLGEVPPWALKQIKANKHHISQVPMMPRLSYIMKSYETREDLCVYHYEDGTSINLGKGKAPETKMRNNLMIAAPIKEMRISDEERIDENGNIVARDPIVCLEVDGGYIVLAAWGEEGQDPQVFNATSN